MPEEPKNYEQIPEIEPRSKLNLSEIVLPRDPFELYYYDEEPEDPTDKNWQIVVKIKDEIRKAFPKTGSFRKRPSLTDELIQFYGDQIDVQRIIQQRSEEPGFDYHYDKKGEHPEIKAFYNKEGKAHQLYYIASIFKGERLDDNEPTADIRRSLQGKKILVLGDDIGSLSELLRFYGAESYGIEMDKGLILVAHSGLLAENGKPQNQVIEGDVSDLYMPSSTELMEQLKTLGPFDMIFSNNFFAHGHELDFLLDSDFAGDEKHPPSLWWQWLNGDKKGPRPSEILRKNCHGLLKKDGAQLHLRVNMSNALAASREESRLIGGGDPNRIVLITNSGVEVVE